MNRRELIRAAAGAIPAGLVIGGQVADSDEFVTVREHPDGGRTVEIYVPPESHAVLDGCHFGWAGEGANAWWGVVDESLPVVIYNAKLMAAKQDRR